ncbi:Alpha/Beta hydrolase protein [Apiospora arundinis]|uniref:Carboxylic ester hydrolase n=1 Tax=Apiospora arundinis TaxID=335852 RepID=A0ABR2IVL4_9PEZI
MKLSSATAACALASATVDASAIATLKSGVVVGAQKTLPGADTVVNQFLGIPYATPPLGAQRFALASPPTPWSTPRNATAWPNACIQQSNTDVLLAPESEDCLYVNVFAPVALATNSSGVDGGRTVMVWIHGGGLKSGSASMTRHDGTSFAAHQDVVVVSMNYRLGPFGFPISPAIPTREQNLGLHDQRMALQWVQENIVHFGGDPAKVTIFGESSGSTSVSRLVGTMNDTASRPFRAAIQQSGVYETAWAMDPPGDVLGPAAWPLLVKSLNCTSSAAVGNNGTSTVAQAAAELECVRAAPASSIRALVNDPSVSWTFVPVNDEITQLADPDRARAEGQIARIPLLIGTNANEGTMSTGSWTSVEAYTAAFPLLAPYAETLKTTYPLGGLGPNGEVLADGWHVNAAIDTDVEYTCPASRVAHSAAFGLGLPVWRYFFNATFANTALGDGFGAYHSSEIPIVFGTYPAANATAAQARLSRTMQTAWADFAKDPYGAGPGWAAVGSGEAGGGYPVVALDVETDPSVKGWRMMDNGTLDSACGMFESLYRNRVGSPWW